MSAPASESFGLTGEQQSVLDAADRYARTHLYPLAARMDLEEWWPAAAFAALGPAGLLGITVPAQYGGAGMDLFASGLVLQGLARWNHALALSWVAHDNLCVNNILRKDFPGFHVAQTLTKMGFRGSQTGELVFQDCRVPLANRIGEENEGIAVLMSGLDLERAMIAPLCLGVAERALALCLQYARERRQFGRPIGDFQMIRGKLADLYVTVETMRTFTYRVLAAANVLEVGGGGRGGIHALTAAAVLHAAEGMNRVLSEALQIHGGSGYLWEAEINRLFRATKLLEIGAGTSEIRRLIIAGELLDA